MDLAVPIKSYRDLLSAQKVLFENQIEKLQQIVATQCKLTGVNPLSQEMAAGALSIKIGKRPRDLLNPKAVKYMKSLFSTKDAISKRETREISAQFGVTVTQVRDFFNAQRTRVRKFARLSREKTNRSSTCGDVALTSDPILLVGPVPLNTMAPKNTTEGPSCPTRHDDLCGKEEPDLRFTENIFSLMRKEDSFSGQVKLLKWIIRMENPSVLNWFLTEGGLMILATWLSEAANEEQTSFLRVVLKVLHYLPMINALPVHMSAVLQSVNRLRFYRTPDISHRARVLLSKWSYMCGKKLSLKINNGLKSASDLEDEMLLKQSIHEVMCVDSWDLKDGKAEEALSFLGDNSNIHRKSDVTQPLKMLALPGDESNKRRGVSSSNMKERRKVQMVDHLGQRSVSRGPPVARSTSTNQSRPLSADDIQKSKMRAQFMQSKYGKTATLLDEKVTPDSQNRCTSSHASFPPSVSMSHARAELEEVRKLDDAVVKISVKQPRETSLVVQEPMWKKIKRIQIPWRTPREVKISEEWCVGEGPSSKEVDVQNNRIKREIEIIYGSPQEIPSDPKDPWDREMDPDDTLTPEIPIEQLPDVEPLEPPPVYHNHNDKEEIVAPVAENIPVPDLELLAELLKNPQLVFALTSGQVGNLSSDATVKLLDMIKTNGVSSLGKLAGNDEIRVEVSLPSPTPSSEHVPKGPMPDFSRNPFSRQPLSTNGNVYHATGSSQPILVAGPTRVLTQPHIPDTMMFTPQPTTTVQQQAHVPPPPPVVASLQTRTQLSEHWHAPPINSQTHSKSRLNTSHTNTDPNFNRPTSNVVGGYNVNQGYSPEHLVYDNTSRARQGFESNYHRQNNGNVNGYYDAYDGVHAHAVVPPGGRNNLVGRSGYGSWSPDSDPSRRREYPASRYYGESDASSRHGQQNMGGAGSKRRRDDRRQ